MLYPLWPGSRTGRKERAEGMLVLMVVGQQDRTEREG